MTLHRGRRVDKFQVGNSSRLYYRNDPVKYDLDFSMVFENYSYFLMGRIQHTNLITLIRPTNIIINVCLFNIKNV